MLNVLSLFDGLGGARISLDQLGIECKYYASEVDKYAIDVHMRNYPDTLQLGDVRNVRASDLPKINLLIGGSPCQNLTMAGKKEGLDGEKSSLFYEYVRLKNELNPEYFLLENVASMTNSDRDKMSELMGVQPIKINSADFSAQNRRRYYWTNLPVAEWIKDDTVLKDILEDVDDYHLSKKHHEAFLKSYKWKSTDINGKSKVLMASYYKQPPHAPYIICKNSESGYRMLSPLECERLQGIPDNEFSIYLHLCIDQAKNYVDVVNKNHKLLKLVLNAEKKELGELVKSAVLNMSASLPQTEYIVPQNVDTQIPNPTEEVCNIFPIGRSMNVSNAEDYALSQHPEQEAVSAVQNVFINIIEGRITHLGMVESPLKDKRFTNQKNGKNVLKLYGKEIMQLARDAKKNLVIEQDKNSIYTTLYPLSTKNIEQLLTIYYLCAKNVIDGYIQNTIQKKSILLKFSIKEGYTTAVSKTQRYKMIGNGFTVPVIKHILLSLKEEFSKKV